MTPIPLKTKLALFLLIISFPFLAKYTFVQHNQYEQIPLILRYLNPVFISGDWYLNSTDLSQTPRYFFVVLTGLFTKLTSLPVIYFLYFVLTIGLTVISTFILSRKLFKSDKIALLTSILYIYGQRITLGNNDDVIRDLDPAKLSFAVTFAALTLIIKNRFYPAAILFALSIYFQPLIGLEIPMIIFTGLIAYHVYKSKKSEIWKLVKSFIFYIVLISPALLKYFNSLTSINTFKSDSVFNTATLKLTLAHHYFPSSWPLSSFIKFALIIFLFLIALRYLYLKKEKIISQQLTFILSGIFFLCLLETVFTEIYPVYNLIIAQLFRLTIFAHWIMSIFIFGYFFSFPKDSKKDIHILYYFFPIVPFLLVLNNGIFIFNLTLLLYIIFSFLISIIITILQSKKTCQFLLPLLVIIVFSFYYRHYEFNFDKYYPFPTPETKVALWVKDHIDNKALILTPPYFFRFRLVSQKPTVVDWLVGPFSEKGNREWLNRIRDVSGIAEKELVNISESAVYAGYDRMDDDRVKFLIDKYEIDYIVTRKNNHLDLTLIYRDEDYNVYKFARATKYF